MKVQRKILQTWHPHATRATKKAKQKQIAATKQAETTLVLATPSTVPPAAPDFGYQARVQYSLSSADRWTD